MDFQAYCLKLVCKFLKKDPLYINFFDAISSELSRLDSLNSELKADFFFNTMSEEACRFFEKFLNVAVKSSATLEERRTNIKAKWRGKGKNCVALLQQVCDSWKNGETVVDFRNGKIKIQFVGEYGTPSDLVSLQNALEEVKPAHLAYVFLYRYLLIREIHNVMTLDELQSHTIDEFAFGTQLS